MNQPCRHEAPVDTDVGPKWCSNCGAILPGVSGGTWELPRIAKTAFYKEFSSRRTGRTYRMCQTVLQALRTSRDLPIVVLAYSHQKESMIQTLQNLGGRPEELRQILFVTSDNLEKMRGRIGRAFIDHTVWDTKDADRVWEQSLVTDREFGMRACLLDYPKDPDPDSSDSTTPKI